MSHTLTESRQALGYALGGFLVTNTDASTGVATTLNLFKQGASNQLAATAFGYQWAYVPDVATYPQARIKQNGLDPATGIVTLEAALGSVAASGAAVELSSLLPSVSDSHAALGGSSLNACVNQALRHLMIEDDSVAVALVSGRYDYDLSSLAALLDRPGRLKAVRVSNGAGSTTRSTSHTWELRPSASGPQLHFDQAFAFSGGSPAMTLVLTRPAFSLVKRLGLTWTTSTTGLVSETDEAVPSVNDVVTVGLWCAYRALAQRNKGPARDTYLKQAADWLSAAMKIPGFELGSEPDTETAPEAA